MRLSDCIIKFSSSPELIGQWHKTSFGDGGTIFFSNEGLCLFPEGDNSESKLSTFKNLPEPLDEFQPNLAQNVLRFIQIIGPIKLKLDHVVRSLRSLF